MLIEAIMSAALTMQPAGIAELGAPDTSETVEVAYDQLSSGDVSAAIGRLEALRVENPDDPALLINLGSAYAQAGRMEQAEEAYQAAATSDVRYSLELADGSWVDSRRAARLALRNLEATRMAMR